MTPEPVDVLIIGAGLSGIGAAVHLQTRCPQRSFVILEGRAAIGGTWDLFRYPGVRSDSDMYTLGYSFKPWLGSKAIADGPSILNYIRETAAEHGIDRNIRFQHRVTNLSWCSRTAHWTVRAERGPQREPVTFTCGFVLGCAGYYDYADGYTPELPGIETFAGQVIHPQHWPEDLDYAGKRIVVIGSGATAVTLVPELAKSAAHVTMLQRSPTYMVARPSEDAFATRLNRRLPARLAYPLMRWRNVLIAMAQFQLARRRPKLVSKALIKLVRDAIGPEHDIATHFTPRYHPWDQRLCLVPDGDLFAAIKSGATSVVTDHIARVTPTGIALQSGRTLDAGIIITATGLRMRLLTGIAIDVDGTRIELGHAYLYKGTMLSGVPNFANFFGYTNASWTLKADLTAGYVCRLLNHMSRHGYASATPPREVDVPEYVGFALTSGYIQRARAGLPRLGAKGPWQLHQNYARDLLGLRYGRVDDGVLRFGRGVARGADSVGDSP